MSETKQGTLPKNIRQIGTGMGNTKIYLEDYVYTYLHAQEEQEEWSRRGFLLLGRMEQENQSVRYFISGLIRLKDGFFKDDIVEFDDGTWAYIYQEMKKYYDNLEIVGWGQDISGASSGMTADLERTHKQNFNIQKNVLYLIDHVEKEEAFYVFENRTLQRREGYYVYYEKNPQMQEYMIQTRKSQELDVSLEEIPEPLVSSYREMLLERKSQIASGRWNGVLYTTSMLLVLSVCVLGVSTVNNVEKMQSLENTVTQISGRMGQGAERDASQETDVSPAMSQNAMQDTQAEADKDTQTAEETVQADDGAKEKDRPETDSADSLTDENSSQETAALTDAQTYLLQGYYVVQKGDSLMGISKKIYGTPDKAEKICELNGIDDKDKIYAGQKLRLP